MASASGCSVRKQLVCHPIHRAHTDCRDGAALLGAYTAALVGLSVAVPRSLLGLAVQNYTSYPSMP
eukprot:COSAG05_NODE_23677_length_256_cov_0.662420_1_plen_65_part_10